MTAKNKWVLAWRRARQGKRLPRTLDEQANRLLIERKFCQAMTRLSALILSTPV